MSEEDFYDKNVEENCEFLRARSKVGEKKYGCPTTDIEAMDAVQHLKEELGDALNYTAQIFRQMEGIIKERDIYRCALENILREGPGKTTVARLRSFAEKSLNLEFPDHEWLGFCQMTDQELEREWREIAKIPIADLTSEARERFLAIDAEGFRRKYSFKRNTLGAPTEGI